MSSPEHTNDLMRALLDNAADDFFVHDEEGFFVDVNQSACERLQYTREELLRMRVYELSTADESISRQHVWNTPVGRSVTVVTAHRRKDRSTFPTEVRVTPVLHQGRRLFFCVARDISDRLHTETELKRLHADLELRVAERSKQLSETEMRWESALDASDEGVFDWDLQTGHVFRSTKWKAMLGYDDSDVGSHEMDWSDLIHPDDVSRVAEEHLRCFRGETPQFNCEYRLRAKDGSWRWVLARGRLVSRTDDGDPARFIGTHLDITERKETAEFLRTAKEAAEAGERAKSAFIASISHELRTPMNGVMVLAELLLESNLDSPQREMIEMMQRSGNELLVLINDVLDYSRLEAGKMRLHPVAFDLRSTIESSARALEVQARNKGLTVVYDIAIPNGRLVLGDVHRLRQIITNLVGNAVKFTNSGSVTLVARERGGTEETCSFVVEVHDTGIGIPRALHSEIFEPFKQGEQGDGRRFGGSGLGLVISREIARAMNGEITFESAEQRGSVFYLELALPRTLLGPEPDAASGEVATAGARIYRPLELLFVEDNEANQRVGKLLLEKLGHRVTLAKTGTEALRLLFEHRYDCILMDCQMPELDGYQTTRQIRRGGGIADAEVPIIALTAAGMPGDRERCLAAGMNDYALKPINRAELAAAFARCGFALVDRALPTPAPLDESAPASLLDPEYLDQLRGLHTASGEPLLHNVAKLVLVEMPSRFHELAENARRRGIASAKGVGRLAHKMAGSCASIGAIPLRERLHAVELAADANADDLEAVVLRAADAWDEVKPLIARLLLENPVEQSSA